MNTVTDQFYTHVQENIFDVNIIDADYINVKNVLLNMCVKLIGYGVH